MPLSGSPPSVTRSVTLSGPLSRPFVDVSEPARPTVPRQPSALDANATAHPHTMAIVVGKVDSFIATGFRA
jgi:hypothetical protein